jgi:hypothetical protein
MPLKDLITVTLQVALDSDPRDDPPIWTTVASNTARKLRSWRVDRGRNSTLDTVSAASATFVLDNRDRLFDPLYSAGAYYGKLKPGKRVRLVARYGGVDYTRFDGFVDGWPQTYPSPSVKDALVQLKATDGFKRASRNQLPSVYRQEVLADSPIAWYRLGESSGTAAFDASGNGNHGTYEGGATFGSAAGLIAFDPDTAIGFDGVDDVINIPAAGCAAGSAFTVTAWVLMNEVTTANDQVIWEQQGAGGQSYTLAVSGTAGDVGTVFWQSVTGTTFDLAVSTGVRVDDGKPHFIAATQSAANALWLRIDDVVVAGDFTTADATTPSGATIGYGYGNNLGIIAGTGRFAGTIDELAVYNSELAAGRLTAQYEAATAPWNGDTPGDRFDKVLDLAAWPASDRDIATGSASLAPADLQGDALTHLQDVALSEGGRFFVSRDGKMTLVGRADLWTDTVYTTSQAAFADDGTGLPYTGFGWDYSDAKVRNEIHINPQAGSEQIAFDTASQDAYGPLSYQQTSLEGDVAKVLSQANWLLQRHKDAALEIDRLDIDPLRSPGSVFPVVLGAELGYRYTIKRTPQGVGSAISQEVHLEGTSESGDSNGYRFSWELSRAEPAVFIVGTSTVGGSARIGY